MHLSKFNFFDFTRSNPGDENSILIFSYIELGFTKIRVVSKSKLQYKKTTDYISKKCNAMLSLASKELNAMSSSWHHLNIVCSDFRIEIILEIFKNYEKFSRDI